MEELGKELNYVIGPGEDRVVKPEVTGKPEVIRKTAITATPYDKTLVKILYKGEPRT